MSATAVFFAILLIGAAGGVFLANKTKLDKDYLFWAFIVAEILLLTAGRFSK